MINELKKKLKKNKILFFTFMKLTSNDYKISYQEYKRNCLKSGEKVQRELDLIQSYWKCDPMHYFRYRLFNKDLSDDELLDYVPPFYFYNIYLKRVFRGVNISIFGSKIFLDNFFKSKEIKSPRVVAIIKGRNIINSSNKIISFIELARILHDSAALKFFLKPDKGRGGKGIVVIEKVKGQLYINEDNLTESYFKKIVKGNNYVLQEGVIQRKDISDINSTSVNTLRIITQCDGVYFEMPVAVMRMGRNKSFVDNSAQGGISININIKTGELSDLAFVEHGSKSYNRHPDTNIVFKGFKIKDWDLIKNKVESFARKINELEEIAWDIAIGEDDIYVIEINTEYGIDHLQCTTGGMRTKLNIMSTKNIEN